MRRVNLLREIDNVRNNLRPDGKKLEQRRDRRRQLVGVLLILGGLGWFWYEGPGWKERPEELLRQIAEERGVNLAPTPKPRGVDDLLAPAESVIEPPPPAPVAATDWRVRYGLCNLEASCAELVAALGPKGIRTELIRGSAPHPTWQVIMGPWPTPTQAEEMRTRLTKEGIEASLTRAAGEAWLVSPPLRQVDEARRLAERVSGQGVVARIEEAPSEETVYKVYDATRYPRREEAEAACRKRKGEGVDCVVEERPL